MDHRRWTMNKKMDFAVVYRLWSIVPFDKRSPVLDNYQVDPALSSVFMSTLATVYRSVVSVPSYHRRCKESS